MKLHWSPRSPFVRKVMIAAHELGLQDNLTLVRSVVMMTAPNPALMADNPLSKIPTLVLDDGAVLLDSSVIVEFLNSVGDGSLLAAQGEERWWALSRQALASGLLDLLILWRNEREKPKERQTPEWLDAFAVKARAALDSFEAQAPAFTSKPFGVGHIALGCALSYMDFRFSDLAWRDGRPDLAAWHRSFAERPSAIATEVVDG